MLCTCEDKKKVVATCETCDEFLCSLCYYAHLRVKITKNHKFKVLARLSPQKKPKLTRNKGTQVKRLKPKNLEMRPVTARALKSNKTCKQYTGLSLNLFNQILDGNSGKFLSSYKMKPKDQLCMFYQKLKTNATNTTLSINFGIDVKIIGLSFWGKISKWVNPIKICFLF